MSTRLNDMLDLLEHSDSSISYLSKANDASSLDRTRALAEIIKLNPDILHRQEDLQGVCNRLGAEQITVSDSDGVVEAAVPESLIGFNLTVGDDIQQLTSFDNTSGYEVYSQVTPGESEHQGSMQFAAVRRLDKPGIIRLGFRTRFEQASREESAVDSPAMKVRLGTHGQVIVFRQGVRLSQARLPVSQAELMSLPDNDLGEIEIDDKQFFTYAVDRSGYRLIGLIPSSEIYEPILKAVQSVLMSNLLLFVLMFAVVSYLLQRIVLRGMSKVNEALRDITEGNLEKRVEVRDSMEFSRLSNGINFMVESLRSVGEERQQSIKRGLELARTLQGAMLPNKFPPFPDINRFDLYATCFQAHDVGGDFYDFSMPDGDHLHFLVADVDASGIPAALYMMRALTIIRSISRFGAEPVQIVSEVNRELCADNQAGIRMALFYGNLDINTGLLEFVSAGKLCALIQQGAESFVPLSTPVDTVLGEDAQASFHTQSLQLEPQDRLFLSTEGVLNVAGTNNVPFNSSRLQSVLRTDAATVRDVLQLVRSSLRHFMDGSKIKKDITMLCMEYKGDLGNKALLHFTAGEPQEATYLIAQQMEEIFAAPLDITDVQNSVEAIASALPADTDIQMIFSCTEQEAEVCLIYGLPEFNPLDHMAAPLPLNRVTHDFIENKENRLTLWKTLT